MVVRQITLLTSSYAVVLVTNKIKGKLRSTKKLGSVYTGPDPFGTGTKLVRISLVFTQDVVDPVGIGSAIWYQMGPLVKVIPYGTAPFQFQTGPV